MIKYKNLYKKNTIEKGFSLVEVLVAMAILTIIVVCFTFAFGWSFENIFLMGDKSKAAAKAQETIERLYVNIDDDEVGLRRVDSTDELYNYYEPGNYYIEPGVDYTLEDEEVEGYKVTAVVFYKNGERNVTFNTFISNATSGD